MHAEMDTATWFATTLEGLREEPEFQAECFILGMEEIYPVSFFDSENS
jgi:hypothetical protein